MAPLSSHVIAILLEYNQWQFVKINHGVAEFAEYFKRNMCTQQIRRNIC